MLFHLGYPAQETRNARPGSRGTSLQTFVDMFPSETACLQHVFNVRFDVAKLCPSCGEGARWTPVVGRRMMRHRRCSKVLFPYSGTLLEHSRVPTQLWFYLMLHLANSHASVNGYFVQRHWGVDLRAAQRMLKRIRLHLAAIDRNPLSAVSNEPVHVRLERIRGAWNPARPSYNRANVLVLARGKLVDFVVVDLYRNSRLRGILVQKLPRETSIVTNCERTARLVSDYGHTKSPVRFEPGVRVTDDLDTIWSFLAYFWRGWRLQHQNVHLQLLWLYLAEYRFRYNRRSRSHETFHDMVSAFPSVDRMATIQLRRSCSDIEG